MALEVGDGQAEAVQKILHRHPEWGVVRVKQDLNGIERVIVVDRW
jgi:methylase of polypeptide subunit release factors